MKKNANKNRKEITMDTRETQKLLEKAREIASYNDISLSDAIQLLRLQNEIEDRKVNEGIETSLRYLR